MDVKEAVVHAKRYIIDLFADENLSNVGLEEVELDDQAKEWVVTIGFSRPWDEPKNTFAAIAAATSTKRSYKIVRISDVTEEVLSVKNRVV